MTLKELQDRLSGMIDYADAEVSIMEEHEVDGRVIQFGSKLTDVAFSSSKSFGPEVILIGQELLVPESEKRTRSRE